MKNEITKALAWKLAQCLSRVGGAFAEASASIAVWSEVVQSSEMDKILNPPRDFSIKNPRPVDHS